MSFAAELRDFASGFNSAFSATRKMKGEMDRRREQKELDDRKRQAEDAVDGRDENDVSMPVRRASSGAPKAIPDDPENAGASSGGYGGDPYTSDSDSGRMKQYQNAIASIESAGSGDYAAIGPRHEKYGRALGRYQVMESNLPQWSKEAIGREVSPDEFLASRGIQDQIFNHKFGEYVQKYGNAEDAASAWFTGGPRTAKSMAAKDSLGTSGSQYVSKFSNNLGRQGSGSGAIPTSDDYLPARGKPLRVAAAPARAIDDSRTPPIATDVFEEDDDADE